MPHSLIVSPIRKELVEAEESVVAADEGDPGEVAEAEVEHGSRQPGKSVTAAKASSSSRILQTGSDVFSVTKSNMIAVPITMPRVATLTGGVLSASQRCPSLQTWPRRLRLWLRC